MYIYMPSRLKRIFKKIKGILKDFFFKNGTVTMFRN